MPFQEQTICMKWPALWSEKQHAVPMESRHKVQVADRLTGVLHCTQEFLTYSLVARVGKQDRVKMLDI